MIEIYKDFHSGELSLWMFKADLDNAFRNVIEEDSDT